MSADPGIAILIGAYRRSEFLPTAVQSALAQTIPRSEFEIVVLTDREDPDLQRGLERSGIALRVDPEPVIGRWLLGGIAATRAPLIAFLDDDDQFEPDRLGAALAAFRADPELGFYRNRVRVVDRSGTEVPKDRWNRLELDTEFDAGGSQRVPGGNLDALMPFLSGPASISFNSSTMVVRREILHGPAAAAFETTQLPDLALVVLAALSGRALYFDAARRTVYRSAPGSATRHFAWLKAAADSQARLGAFAAREGGAPLARWLLDRSVHYDRMYRGESVVESVRAASSRHAVAGGALDYLRFLGHHPREWSTQLDVWAAPLYAGGYVLAPPLARRLAVARPTAGRA